MKIISINETTYKVKEAKTQEQLENGLKGVEKLPKNQGMLFYIKEPKEQVLFTMKGCKIPLDIIYINQDFEVVDVIHCNPRNQNVINSLDNMDDDDVIEYVLELNKNSGVEVGQEVDLDDDDDEGPVMKVLAQDGSEQMALWGGERIVSRRETKIIVNKAKKANSSQSDSDFKALGKYIFKVIDKQDSRPAEYVKSADN